MLRTALVLYGSEACGQGFPDDPPGSSWEERDEAARGEAVE